MTNETINGGRDTELEQLVSHARALGLDEEDLAETVLDCCHEQAASAFNHGDYDQQLSATGA